MASSQAFKSPADTPFQINVPAITFEKADAPEGQQRRIAGIISTDGLDSQNEKLLQEGLSFDRFVREGFFNDEHSSSVCDVVGYPQSVKFYKKGDALPNGEKAPNNLHWTEGFLCGRKGRDLWDLAHELKGSGRTLGFSVEGQIDARKAESNNIITSAQVTGVALCQRPVNSECRVMTLVRSMEAAAAAKAFTLGTVPEQREQSPIPQPAPNVPKTGDGAGQVLSAIFKKKKERLKKRRKNTAAGAKKSQKSATKAVAAPEPILLTEEQALRWVRKAVVGVDEKTARAFLHTAQRLVTLGLA